jgi:hypothetical protein
VVVLEVVLEVEVRLRLRPPLADDEQGGRPESNSSGWWALKAGCAGSALASF